MKAARNRKPILISFSGLDGAGKTTQIENLRSLVHAFGMRDALLTFWDNVVVLSRYRERFVHKVYGSERGIGAPDKPVERRDKNVRAWYLSLIRHGLYLLDTLHLRWVVAGARRSKADVIIMDRYIYDELANLPLKILSLGFLCISCAGSRQNRISPTCSMPTRSPRAFASPSTLWNSCSSRGALTSCWPNCSIP